MASFPLLQLGPVEVNQRSWYEIEASHSLHGSQLFTFWYQDLVLGLGIATILLGLANLYRLFGRSQPEGNADNPARPDVFVLLYWRLVRTIHSIRDVFSPKSAQLRKASLAIGGPLSLSNMTTFQVLAQSGGPSANADKSLCIVPLNKPSPQKAWDQTYTPSIKAARIAKANHLKPYTGTQTPDSASGYLSPRSGLMSPSSRPSTPRQVSQLTVAIISPVAKEALSKSSPQTGSSSDDDVLPHQLPKLEFSEEETFDLLSFFPNEGVAEKPDPSSSLSLKEEDSSEEDDDDDEEDDRPTVPRPPANSLFFGQKSFTSGTHLSSHDYETLAVLLRDTCVDLGYDGLVLRFDDTHKASNVNSVLARLKEDGVPVIFMAESDAMLLDSVHFGLISGVILENAHILRNGKRRDFFRAARLRDQISRIKTRKEQKPDFFFGFLELWKEQPSAAVLRRAYKLADFYGAVITARPLASGQAARPKREMPLSGFDYLKKMDVVWCQKQWSTDAACDFAGTKDSDSVVKLDLDELDRVLPSASELMAPKPFYPKIADKEELESAEMLALDYGHMSPRISDFWNTSSCGAQLSPLGCFSLREEVVHQQYDELVKTQRHLRDLEMLHLVSLVELNNTIDAFHNLARATAHPVILQELREGIRNRSILVYKGLDSGFTLPDNGGHFWGLSEEEWRDTGLHINIYISQKCADEAATIWHTYLAHRGVPRSQRFVEELGLEQDKPNQYGVAVPKTIIHDLENSTEAEILYLLQRIRLSTIRHSITNGIKVVASKLLLEDTTRDTWNNLHSKSCLDDSTSLRDVFQTRLDFMQTKGAQSLPDADNLVELHRQLDEQVKECLFNCNRADLNRLLGVILMAYSTAAGGKPVDVNTDLFTLIFFSILRKYAFEDVYMETTDRCPMFLSQHDQAGVFSELWVLGSQCAIYFGILPRALGEIIWDKYRAYLDEFPPPVESFNGKDVFTAYTNATSAQKIEGIDPFGRNEGSEKTKKLPGDVPGYKLNEPIKDKRKFRNRAEKFGALSIFCFPAILDVLLLTFIGRGFYLTAFMSEFNVLYFDRGEPQSVGVTTMANYAILTALIMTGGITGWVGSTGGFYLFNYAFESMTYFLVQRFTGAVMLTIGVAFCGFFAFGAMYSWFYGFIFIMYLFALTTFLNLLGIFATMHRAASPLTSGRTAMWKCIPILFISPILTTFVINHDLLIYLLVIYAFVVVLLITFRNLCHEWTTWQGKVPTIKEKDLVNWFKEKTMDPEDEDEYDDPQILAAEARALLNEEVERYNNRSLYMKLFYKIQDEFVEKMAIGHPFAMWLLKKEAGDAELPETYTPTWFVQLELALGNQRQMVRGLREHSQFITFRYSKYDLGQNVGLFLSALMDRWVFLAMSAREPQPSLAIYRYVQCFGLLYFLFGAVCVDMVLQKYWPKMTTMSNVKMTTMEECEKIRENEDAARRKFYRTGLMELLTCLTIIFGSTSLLMWAFYTDSDCFGVFYSYVSGYTGVLLAQFHRCFTKSPRMHVITVFVSCAIAFVVGCLLRAAPGTAAFVYDTVIALNIASVLSAVGTFYWTGYFTFSKKPAPRAAADRLDADDRLIHMKSEFAKDAMVGMPIDHSSVPCGETHHAIRDILRNLTLGIDVNTKWAALPEDVREVIIKRVIGGPVKISWAVQDWLKEQRIEISSFTYGINMAVDDLRRATAANKESVDPLRKLSYVTTTVGEPELSASLPQHKIKDSIFVRFGNSVVHALFEITKWVAIVSGAASDVPKELWYALHRTPCHGAILWVSLKIWKVCWLLKNTLTLLILIWGKENYNRILRRMNRGTARTLYADRITIDQFSRVRTGFISVEDKKLVVALYDGHLPAVPEGKKALFRAFYDSTNRLNRREMADGVVHAYHYDQHSDSRWPVFKSTYSEGEEHRCMYDKYGRVESGRIILSNVEFSFEYVFSKQPKGNAQILQAKYASVVGDLDMTATIFWCIKPRAGSRDVKTWTPSEKIMRAIITIDEEVMDVKWNYRHAQMPEIITTITSLDGMHSVQGIPDVVSKDKFGFLKKPWDLHFEYEDILVYHPKRWVERVRREHPSFNQSWTLKIRNRILYNLPLIGVRCSRKVVYRKLTTAQLRTKLWKAWAKPPYLDAVTASFLDEMILRREDLLQKYWSLRDAGFLLKAANALDENLEQIVSTIEPMVEASQTCPLYIKISDLFEMGLGKDSTRYTARPEDTYRDTATSTSVIFSDNGCWPDNPGGVSNCRRDLVNGHTTIRGHCLAEGANDFGVPRYQIERNINSLKVLPLWGLDGKTPYHGIMDNLLQAQVDERITMTDDEDDVQAIFIPLLTSFVKGARSRRYTREDLITYSNVILKMNRYLETRDFNKTWKSESLWAAWVEAWLIDYQDPNVLEIRDMLEIEKPSMADFRGALDLYICYFFIFSVELPTYCPKVFQTTHHGISSLYGILLKYRRGTTWGIWDHAILWREMCLNISPAQCLLPVPVQSMLLAGVKLACHLAYTHADIILPCTSVFNPDWEMDLGTDQGLRGSKKLFARKIDPIVNGISNMDSFQPVTETRSKFPTTVMLSNVQFIKDVKNAVLAADVIINKFGFQDYRLTVYGAQDRQPSYALETTTLINTRGMSQKVTLAGFGSPKEVLKDAWLFMNSSLSEGLPLAIGEAALSGIPIVATEVGATALVLTDPDDPTKRYGEVVPPNDPEALARAQISLLAMLGQWTAYTTDDVPPPPLPDTFTPEDVEWITKRIYSKQEDRKALGLKLRDVVLRSFHGKRYLREHEQMYWIQRKHAEVRRNHILNKIHPPNSAVFGERNVFSYDAAAEAEQDPRPRWQDLNVKLLRKQKSEEDINEKV